MVDDVQKLEQKQPVALRIPILASVALAAIAATMDCQTRCTTVAA